MNAQKAIVDQFLMTTAMHPESVDIKVTVQHMMDEMTQGLEGKPSSLQMIPTYIEVDKNVPVGERVVVLDAGGTNLRAALVSFSQDGEPVVENFSKQAMPGTQDGEISRRAFFESLAVLVEPLLKKAGKIGFCFSYPTDITPNRDGRLIHWSKEIQAPEVEGRMIGSDLKDALRNRGMLHPPEVVILNDTVATLLTGKASQSGRDWGGFVGFILGTGTNTCYVDANSVITKSSGLDPANSQIINCEFGGFAPGSRGRADEILGDTTAKPETYWLEKMLSGGYFGALLTQLILLAGREGLLSQGFINAVTELGTISTKDADNYAHNPTDVSSNALASGMRTSGTLEDAQRLWFLVDALLERAARLTAANLAASVLKGRYGEGPLNPVCITIDGTTYYRYYRFQTRVESYLRPFLTTRNKFYETVQVKDAPLIGAAVAALTN